MPGNSKRDSRRDVLKLTGGTFAAAGMAGMASAAGSGDVQEFNVGFSTDGGRQAAVDAADAVKREFSFDAVTIEANANAVQGLERRPDVRYVEENGTMYALDTLPWGIDRTDSDVVHANGETGNGVDIAIIDTGIDSDHETLQDNIGAGKAFETCNTRGGCRFGVKPADNTCHYDWDDDNNHGTHCAGTADGASNGTGVVGVSTEATLHAVKVLDKCGSGSFDNVAAGIEYTADQGWDVGSMSLGGSASSVVEDACQYAVDRGVVLVAAAGNDGPCSDCVGYPAAYSTTIAVSATSCDDSLADFSSQGPEVDIAAPGEDVYSSVASNGGYDTYSGTSMATPHVAGAIAQVIASGSSDPEGDLLSSAEDIGLSDNEQGSGLLDVATALDYDSSNDGSSC